MTPESPAFLEGPEKGVFQVIICEITEDNPVCFNLRKDVHLSRLKVKYAEVKELDPNCLKLVSDLSTMTPVDETATISSSDLPNPAVLYVLHRPRDLTPLQF
jgi:hypothetical protein|uniref:Uncharacterized protein n=1 Tax=Eutreptiella gymnastica TaxID=73025 RepID=A0A7S4LN24_9EUGL|mmetsp:Transcript_84574/g.141349  ORF Transcript_84574/g.141349 Transcript_84574/m.141349 type:complete len:102 (-) Transcript_84574:1151-1456(-)